MATKNYLSQRPCLSIYFLVVDATLLAKAEPLMALSAKAESDHVTLVALSLGAESCHVTAGLAGTRTPPGSNWSTCGQVV